MGFNLVLVVAAGVIWFICHGLRLWDRARLYKCHIPQVPFLPMNFLLGHLTDLAKTQPCYLYDKWRQQLGGIYAIFLGKAPVVVLTDPKLIRQASVSKFKSFHDRSRFIDADPGKDKRVRSLQAGLLMAKGGYWASVRAAMQPLFHQAALQGYTPLMNAEAERLADKLGAAAESGQPLEVHALLKRVTLAVIGQAAFGIPFSLDHADADYAAGLPNVGAAVDLIFRLNRLTTGGGLGGALMRVLPRWMEVPLFRVFFVGGKAGSALEYSRCTLMSAADLLMTNALRRAESKGEKVTMEQTDWQWWGRDFVDKNPYKDTLPAENSVIDMLMRSRNKETGAGLTDMQIGAQCSTVIAGGFETSANTLAFTLHLLAHHPEAQAKLLAEVDAFGRDKALTLEDLPKFPYLDAVIHESLRLYPPGWIGTRVANEDVVLGDQKGRYLIPQGTHVHINIFGLHRDPAIWPEPEAFRPERFLNKEEMEGRHSNAWLAFGVGPRMCIGWKFAMQEMELVLIRLFQQYTFKPAAGCSEEAIKLHTSITFICYGLRLWDRLIRLRHIPQVPFLPRNFLVGHLLELSRTQPCYVYTEWQQKLGGIYLVFLGKSPVVVISDPELARQVSVSKFKSFHDRFRFIDINPGNDKRIRALQSGLLMAKGGYWASVRAAMQPLFHQAALQGYTPVMNDKAEKLTEQLQGVARSGEAVELHALLGRVTMGVIGEAAFGVPFFMDHAEEDYAAGKPNIGAAVKIIFGGGNRLATGGGVGGTLLRVLPSWAEGLLFRAFFVVGAIGKPLEYARNTLMSTGDLLMTNALRRAQSKGERVTMKQTDWQWWGRDFVDKNPYKETVPAENSVIDMLMRATNKETGSGLSDMQIGAQCNTLIAAGYETSANTLAFTLHLLAHHPEAQAKLLAEVDAFGRDKVPTLDDLPRFPYADAVIRESLRLYPPGWMTTRVANEDVVLENKQGRYLIPRETQIHINIFGMQRDPAIWPKPDAFRPERFLDEEEKEQRHPNAWLAFGVGPRMCIGWKFAMQEMELVLIRLFQQYTFQPAPGRSQEALKIRTGITVKQKVLGTEELCCTAVNCAHDM
ncbi:hypothetical protein N2152v2_006528 [Parachlorella kessleri]